MKRLLYPILLLFICSSCNEFLEMRDSYEKSRVEKIQEENTLVDSTCTEMRNVYFDDKSQPHDIIIRLQKYLDEASPEQLKKDWEELEPYNQEGPEMIDSLGPGYD